MRVLIILVSLTLATVVEAQQPNENVFVGTVSPLCTTFSDWQLDRMFKRLAAEETAHLRGIESYVMVIGNAPKLSLLGDDPDLGLDSSGLGPVIGHAEMMAVAKPPTVTQAARADVLGIASSTAVAVIAPLAVKALTGLFHRGDEDALERRQRFTVYTQEPLDRSGPVAALSVPFFRVTGQPVAISIRLGKLFSKSVEVSVNGQLIGVFDESVNDIQVPDAFLIINNGHDHHLLTATMSSGVEIEQLDELEAIVVVYTEPR